MIFQEFLLPAGYESAVLLFTRLSMGAVMIYYGWQKLRDPKANAKDFVGMGFRPGWFWGTIVMIVEFLGGVAVILGLFVPVVAALFGFQMILGAGWKRFSASKPFSDYSYDILLLALALVLLMFGPGAYIISI